MLMLLLPLLLLLLLFHSFTPRCMQQDLNALDVDAEVMSFVDACTSRIGLCRSRPSTSKVLLISPSPSATDHAEARTRVGSPTGTKIYPPVDGPNFGDCV
ncbi:hypothetical protein F4825DRAFT_410278 [Nemania diffusa]|nr:hypothetical protein F4825DRAFT_410278 [Nemania diffusa]